MSRIQLTSIGSTGGIDPVYFVDPISGDGTALVYAPEVVTFSPLAFSNSVAINTNIVLTFDQDIQFSSTSGTIELRRDTSTGTLIESYVTGSSGNLSIVNNTLTINPTNDLQYNTTYYVIIPSVGIANTFGGLYPGTSSYYFRTTYPQLELSGGTHEFTRSDPGSPTGYYKYHVFLGTGPLTFNAPSESNPGFYMIAVAGGGSGGTGYSPSYAAGGGGGAGGVVTGPGPNFIPIPGPASYTVTIGSGGSRVPYTSPPSPSYNGNDTIIGSSPTSYVVKAFGGGNGGGYPYPNPTVNDGRDGGSGGGGGGGPNPFIEPTYPVSGSLNYFGGYATVPSHGNNGGRSSFGYVPTIGRFYAGGGGGGAGGTGGNASFPTQPGPTWPTIPTSSVWNVTGGTGGAGSPKPAFASPILSGNTPLIPTTVLSEIGPAGRYGGGGGGGAPNSTPYARAGNGGPGGGGHGAWVNPSGSSPNPSPFSPETGSEFNAEDGFQYTGGGGGGGISPNPSAYLNGAGGSGIVLIRYSVPSL